MAFTKLTDEDLERLSQITEQDILVTHQTIVKALDRQYKNLILAQEENLFSEKNEQ